jgi:hypothetical protein
MTMNIKLLNATPCDAILFSEHDHRRYIKRQQVSPPEKMRLANDTQLPTRSQQFHHGPAQPDHSHRCAQQGFRAVTSQVNEERWKLPPPAHPLSIVLDHKFAERVAAKVNRQCFHRTNEITGGNSSASASCIDRHNPKVSHVCVSRLRS